MSRTQIQIAANAVKLYAENESKGRRVKGCHLLCHMLSKKNLIIDDRFNEYKIEKNEIFSSIL